MGMVISALATLSTLHPEGIKNIHKSKYNSLWKRNLSSRIHDS
jgi:hypothetical protein